MQKHDSVKEVQNGTHYDEQRKDDVFEGVTAIASMSFKDQLKALKNHRRAVLAGKPLSGRPFIH